MDVIKQRTQAQSHLTTVQVLKNLIRSEGFQGLYRSYLTTLLREIPFGTIQFPLWEHLKLLVQRYDQKNECQPYQSAICGGFAGINLIYNSN